MNSRLPRRTPTAPTGPAWTVHLAAAPAGGIQTCAACGITLLDRCGRYAIPEATADREPSWWPTGERVATLLATTYLVQPDGRPLAADERHCPGVN